MDGEIIALDDRLILSITWHRRQIPPATPVGTSCLKIGPKIGGEDGEGGAQSQDHRLRHLYRLTSGPQRTIVDLVDRSQYRSRRLMIQCEFTQQVILLCADFSKLAITEAEMGIGIQGAHKPEFLSR